MVCSLLWVLFGPGGSGIGVSSRGPVSPKRTRQDIEAEERMKSKCEHNRERSRCKDCHAAGVGGGSICEHDKIRCSCSICSPKQAYARYERQAIERHFLFELTFEQFVNIVEDRCVFCGEWPAGGADRRNSRVGYVDGNCQPCCSKCNRLKSDLNEHDFLRQIFKIGRYQEELQKQKSTPPPDPVKPEPKPEMSTGVAEPEPPRTVPNVDWSEYNKHLDEQARRFLGGI